MNENLKPWKWKIACSELRNCGVMIDSLTGYETINFMASPDHYRIPDQPVPDDIADWQEWCLQWAEWGLLFVYNGNKPTVDLNFTMPKEYYRIAAQPIPYAWLGRHDHQRNMNTYMREILDSVPSVQDTPGNPNVTTESKADIAWRMARDGSDQIQLKRSQK